MKYLFTLLLILLGATAQANSICSGCEYRENFAGTFLGVFDALRGDIATFQNTDVGGGSFTNFWVFDVSPDAISSMSADFTLLAGINNFVGTLFRDDGSNCGGNQCQSIELGALLARSVGDPSRWEIINFLQEGRYILQITGRANPINNGAYTGQMSFLAFTVQEGGSLALFGLGLIAIAVAVRKYRRIR
jgi:hypothetical protein